MLGLVVVVVLVGCQYTVDHTPRKLSSVYGDIAPLEVSGPVRVINGQPSAQKEMVETNFRKLSVDYHEYSETAVELLRNAIVRGGGSVSAEADKSIAVRVTNLTLIDSLGDVHSSVDATVRLDNGLLRGFQGSGAGQVGAAVDQALRQLVIKILSNQEIRAYMTN